MSNMWWIFVISHVCQSFLHGKDFSFIPAACIDIIDCSSYMPLSVALAEGYMVSRKQHLLGSFSCTVVY